MPNQIVVAYDGSAAGQRAAVHAAEVAQQSSAGLIIAHVLEWSPYSFLTAEEVAERHKRRGEELARAETAVVTPLMADLARRGITATSDIRYGHVAETICTIASESGAAQIIIGRTGERGIATRLFGSVAGTLAQIAPVPVTIVP